VRSLYFAVYPAIHEIKPLLLALRFVGAGLVLFLPTFLMGGTLPILVRGVTGKSKELGGRVSRLYWVNTLGAAAGTIFAGFILLPQLGLRLTIACAVALNLLAGLVALQISRDARNEGAESTGAEPTSINESTEDLPQVGNLFLLIVFGFVGATAIAYEISWTRLLATILGSSTYAFTLMLATFLGGIVLGSFLFERWAARGREVSFVTISIADDCSPDSPGYARNVWGPGTGAIRDQRPRDAPCSPGFWIQFPRGGGAADCKSAQGETIGNSRRCLRSQHDRGNRWRDFHRLLAGTSAGKFPRPCFDRGDQPHFGNRA
jgi:hypothetical protein